MNVEDLLRKTHAAFNARDIEAVLAVMQPDVDWPNGMGKVESLVMMRSEVIGRDKGK